MLSEEEKAIERLNNYKEYILKCGNKKSKHFKAVVTVLNMLKEKDKEIEKKDSKIKILEQLYKNIKSDFDDYKNNKDINYLDGIHHKELVKKSIGQIIDKPEECWFDKIEVKVMKNDTLHKVDINDDFITLKQISDSDPDACITVIAESPLSGAIYRYNNYGNKKWQLIGTMLGYA